MEKWKEGKEGGMNFPSMGKRNLFSFFIWKAERRTFLPQQVTLAPFFWIGNKENCIERIEKYNQMRNSRAKTRWHWAYKTNPPTKTQQEKLKAKKTSITTAQKKQQRSDPKTQKARPMIHN